jgi:hypothetical protein
LHDDGFDAYDARPETDPRERKENQRDYGMEKRPTMKDGSHMKTAVRREEWQEEPLPRGNEETPHAEDVASSDCSNDTEDCDRRVIASSNVDVEMEVSNHTAAASAYVDAAAEVDALVDKLLHRAEKGGSSGEEDDVRSNYSDDESARHRKKDKRRSRGKSVSDTDEDDLEAEEQMLEDVVDENESPVRRGASRRKRLTAKEKGKGRAVESQNGASGGEEDDGGECNPKGRCTPGPLSADARKEAQELGEETQKAIALLAKKYNKPYGSIMVAAGLGIQNTRQAPNFSNQYKSWYSAKYPKNDKCEFFFPCLFKSRLTMDLSVSFAEYRDQIYDAYRYFQKMFAYDDDVYAEACQPIIDFCNKQTVDHDNFDGSTKAVVAHMQSAKEQFTNLVCVDLFVPSMKRLTNISVCLKAHSWWNMYGVAILGTIIYVGTDAGGRQSSSVFSGAPMVKGVLDKNLTNVSKIVDQLTTAFK